MILIIIVVNTNNNVSIFTYLILKTHLPFAFIINLAYFVDEVADPLQLKMSPEIFRFFICKVMIVCGCKVPAEYPIG